MTDPIRAALPDREVLARIIYDAFFASIPDEYVGDFRDDFTATIDGGFDFLVIADRIIEALAAAKDQTND
jgi:hypothetical protein